MRQDIEMEYLSTRLRKSEVRLVDGLIYKEQPKYLADNEMWCLEKMAKYECVPWARRISPELIEMEYIESEPITNMELFKAYASLFLFKLEKESIRHGDLTKPHVIVRKNRIHVIDWAESRYWYDPRPDKRTQGDEYWWTKTVKQLLAQ